MRKGDGMAPCRGRHASDKASPHRGEDRGRGRREGSAHARTPCMEDTV